MLRELHCYNFASRWHFYNQLINLTCALCTVLGCFLIRQHLLQSASFFLRSSFPRSPLTIMTKHYDFRWVVRKLSRRGCCEKAADRHLPGDKLVFPVRLGEVRTRSSRVCGRADGPSSLMMDWNHETRTRRKAGGSPHPARAASPWATCPRGAGHKPLLSAGPSQWRTHTHIQAGNVPNQCDCAMTKQCTASPPPLIFPSGSEPRCSTWRAEKPK